MSHGAFLIRAVRYRKYSSERESSGKKIINSRWSAYKYIRTLVSCRTCCISFLVLSSYGVFLYVVWACCSGIISHKKKCKLALELSFEECLQCNHVLHAMSRKQSRLQIYAALYLVLFYLQFFSSFKTTFFRSFLQRFWFHVYEFCFN